MLVELESEMPVADVGTEGVCIWFGGLKSTIAEYDNVSV